MERFFAVTPAFESSEAAAIISAHETNREERLQREATLADCVGIEWPLNVRQPKRGRPSHDIEYLLTVGGWVRAQASAVTDLSEIPALPHKLKPAWWRPGMACLREPEEEAAEESQPLEDVGDGV